MKKLFFVLLLLTNFSYGQEYKADPTSKHLLAEFWQRADGLYYIRVISLDETGFHPSHCFFFDTIYHSPDCPCCGDDIGNLFGMPEDDS